MKSANKITYETFTERVANHADVSEAEADDFIHQFSETAGDALEAGDEVQLYRFGRFVTEHVEERPGHNPRTGKAITIPEHTRVEFRPYKALLLAVNWPFRHLRTRMLAEEEVDTRLGWVGWLLLLLVLLALLLAGLGFYSWLSSRGGDTTTPAAAAVSTEPVPVETAPVVAAEPAVATAEASDTAVFIPTKLIAAATAAALKTAAATTTGIVVAQGDTLWGIAASQWGDPFWWPVIYAENRTDLGHRNPDLIQTGISLRLPVLEGSVTQPTAADLRLRTNAYRIVAEDYTRADHARAAEYRFVADRGFGE